MDAADNAADVLSGLAERVAEMHALMGTPRPEYEYSVPFSFGGAAGGAPYALNVPFSTPCEVALIAITSIGGETGNVALTTEPLFANAQLATTNAVAVPATNFLLVCNTFNSTTTFAEHWFPLSGATSLYMQLSSNFTKTVVACVQFRRRINPAGVPSQGYP